MRSGVFNNITAKVLILLITALLLTMVGSQAYRILNDRHDTQEAVLYSINEDIDFQGVIGSCIDERNMIQVNTVHAVVRRKVSRFFKSTFL